MLEIKNITTFNGLDTERTYLDQIMGIMLFCNSHEVFSWQEYILKELRNKTVIYVTHQMEFLPEADLILVSFLHGF